MKFRLYLLLMILGSASQLWAAPVEPLTPGRYVELSIARLEMVKTQWTYLHRNPNDAEMDALWQRFSTNAHEFAHYYARNSKPVDAYLAARPDLAQRIDELSQEVRQLIQDATSPPPEPGPSAEPSP